MSENVFICYAREDEAFVLQLADNLRGRGVPVWLDQWDIPPGADWDRSIDDAIYACGKFIIVLSPHAVESSEVRGELRIAIDEKKRIIPLIQSPCRIPRQLLTIQYVDFVSRGPDDELALKQLLRTLATATAVELAPNGERIGKMRLEIDESELGTEGKRTATPKGAGEQSSPKSQVASAAVMTDVPESGSFTTKHDAKHGDNGEKSKLSAAANANRDDLERKFAEVLRAPEASDLSSSGVGSVSPLPWFVFLGEAGSGKSEFIKAAGPLSSIVSTGDEQSTRNCELVVFSKTRGG